MKIHDFKFRIYYKDTDASGIAYHANYLAYAERARSEWFNEAGMPITELLARGDAFVVCLEGKAEIELNGEKLFIEAGQSLIMPANAPHALKAVSPYKMLLTVVKA